MSAPCQQLPGSTLLDEVSNNRNHKHHTNHWSGGVTWKPRFLASALVRICLPLVGNLFHQNHALLPHSQTRIRSGADWLEGDHSLPAEFKTVEKHSFVLAGSSGIDLHSPFLCELLNSSAGQASQP